MGSQQWSYLPDLDDGEMELNSFQAAMAEQKALLAKILARLSSMNKQLDQYLPSSSLLPYERPSLNFPRFAGGNPSCWITTARRFFEYYGTNEESRLLISSLHMDGDALKWLRQMKQRASFTTWINFVEALEMQFGDHSGREVVVMGSQPSSVEQSEAKKQDVTLVSVEIHSVSLAEETKQLKAQFDEVSLKSDGKNSDSSNLTIIVQTVWPENGKQPQSEGVKYDVVIEAATEGNKSHLIGLNNALQDSIKSEGSEEICNLVDTGNHRRDFTILRLKSKSLNEVLAKVRLKLKFQSGVVSREHDSKGTDLKRRQPRAAAKPPWSKWGITMRRGRRRPHRKMRWRRWGSASCSIRNPFPSLVTTKIDLGMAAIETNLRVSIEDEVKEKKKLCLNRLVTGPMNLGRSAELGWFTRTGKWALRRPSHSKGQSPLTHTLKSKLWNLDSMQGPVICNTTEMIPKQAEAQTLDEPLTTFNEQGHLWNYTILSSSFTIVVDKTVQLIQTKPQEVALVEDLIPTAVEWFLVSCDATNWADYAGPLLTFSLVLVDSILMSSGSGEDTPKVVAEIYLAREALGSRIVQRFSTTEDRDVGVNVADSVTCLRQTHRRPLCDALEKTKEGSIVLGLLYPLLIGTSRTISGICIETNYINSRLDPCSISEVEASGLSNSIHYSTNLPIFCQHGNKFEHRIATLEFDRDHKLVGVMKSASRRNSLLVTAAVENVLERSYTVQLLGGSEPEMSASTTDLILLFLDLGLYEKGFEELLGLSNEDTASILQPLGFSAVTKILITGMPLSLMLNFVGLYQISKLSMILVVYVMEWILYSKQYSNKLKMAVSVVGECVVGSRLTGVKINAKGFLCADIADVVTPLLQIFKWLLILGCDGRERVESLITDDGCKFLDVPKGRLEWQVLQGIVQHCIEERENIENLDLDQGGATVYHCFRESNGDYRLTNRLHFIHLFNNSPTGLVTTTLDLVGKKFHSAKDDYNMITTSNVNTIEAINDKAEGRLALANVWVYACHQAVEKTIDLATLTGACVVAIESIFARYFTPIIDRADRVLIALRISGEQFERMRLEAGYQWFYFRVRVSSLYRQQWL